MDHATEMDEFRRMKLITKVDRAEMIIGRYRENIAYFRERLDNLHHLLGRIGQRLGDPEPEEPA